MFRGRGPRVRRRCDLQLTDVPASIQDFVERHEIIFSACVTVLSNLASSPKPLTGPKWLHEVKYNGYRLIIQREGKRVRLFTRNGQQISAQKLPSAIAVAFVIDGDGIFMSDFEQGEIGPGLFRIPTCWALRDLCPAQNQPYRAGSIIWVQ